MANVRPDASGVPHSGCGGYFGYDQGRGRVGVGRTRGPQGEAGDGVGPRRGLWRRAGAVEDREAALGRARPAPEERAPAVFGRVPTLAFGAAAYSSRRPGRRGAERRVGPRRRIGDEESRRERAPRETEEGRGRGRGCGVRGEGEGWRVGGWSDEGCVERGHRVVSRVQVCAPAQVRGVVAAARCAER